MIDASSAYNAALERELIFPKWKLLSFNPATDTWEEIIAGSYGQTPIDLTPYVVSIEYSFDRLRVTLSDTPDLLFHPDGGAQAGALAQGRIIRLLEGFEGLAESEWLWTFTGTVEGSYSWVQQRGQAITATFSVYNRGNNQAFKRRTVTSKDYTVGSDWSAMFMNIVKDVMLLSDTEVVVPEPWGVLFDKNSNQAVNIPPWDVMELLLLAINAKPWFNGKGQLAMYKTSQDRVTLKLANDNYLRKYETREVGESVNKVLLLYLSNTLSRVDGPDQQLGSATVTAGFFKLNFEVPVYYSDDRKTRCDNPRLLVKASANAGLLSFCSESMTKVDEFHSNVNVEVSVWAPTLATTLLAMYMTLAFFPFDVGLAEGLFVNVVEVINPWGRIAQAVVLIGILFIMMCIGTGQYELWGAPYEMVYLEQQVIAQKAGLDFWAEREKEIRNDFVSTIEQARAIALNELHFEVMKEQPRQLLLRYDPRIEPGDIIELSTTTKVWVESVQRQVKRNNTENVTMTVSGYRTVM